MSAADPRTTLVAHRVDNVRGTAARDDLAIM
jgi:hypothetical protein